MEVRQQSTRGVIQGDCIKLLEPVSLADGTLVEVTITASPHSREARERQRRLLRTGIHFGGPPYPKRQELHER